MRKAGVAALVAALMVGLTPIAVAQSVPVPAPAPKKPVPQSPNQPPRPLAPVGPAATTSPGAAPRPTGGFDATQRALVDRVSGYLSGLQTLVGDFVQVGPDGQRTEGQFFIQKPGKVRFEYNPPSPVDVVADGHSVVVRDRKLDTQQLFSLSQTPLRFLLSDRIDLLRDTNLVSVSADDTFVTVVIEETQTPDRHQPADADGRREGFPVAAMDGDRPAGLRHHGRGLQPGHHQEARSEPVQDHLFGSSRPAMRLVLDRHCPRKRAIRLPRHGLLDRPLARAMTNRDRCLYSVGARGHTSP